MTATTVVGTSPRRLDLDDKITGKARYASDIQLPGMLYGKIVRSDRPHARILKIDVSAAEELPGVEAVVYGDIGGYFGEAVRDQRLFAVEKVRFIGEPIAAIAADTAATAELAASLINVEYDDLPAVFHPLDALAPDAPLIHDDLGAFAQPEGLVRYGNVCGEITLAYGDIDSAFAAADKIVEGVYSAHSAHQAPMEPRAAVAEVDGNGALTIRASTQAPFAVRHQLHEALGLSYGDLRVVAETVGGGFGSKTEAHVENYAALLARETGRPVKVANTREEDLSFGSPRHPMLIQIKTALDANGNIAARQAKATMDAGAYSGGSPLLAAVAAMLIPGPYRIPNLKVDVLAVHTNNVNFSAYRGPTGPQAVFAVESHTDEIAKQLGLDPVTFRMRNIFTDGDTGHSGQPLPKVALRETIAKAAEAIDLGTENPPSRPGWRRGKGIACGWWPTSAGASGCSILFNEDGTISVQSGAAEIGTGAVMAAIPQIVAEELGVRYEDIRMVWGDTASTPMDAGALGSRTLFNMGRAAQRAAQAAKAELIRRAADLLEAAEADLDIRDGLIRVKGVPDQELTIAELTKTQMWTSEPIQAGGSFVVDPTDYDPSRWTGSLLQAFNAASFHCHAAEVEVDPDTGKVEVIDYVAVQDAGFAVFPQGVEGQMEGGAVQGIGYSLFEELIFEDGRVANPNLALYKLPTALDVPKVRTVIVESASEHGPYGAKGVGEPPVVFPSGAIANAVARAIGVPVHTTPISAERVLRSLREGESATIPNIDLFAIE
jgi:CO/xanthine dehydrogenase Mo-binding subunit